MYVLVDTMSFPTDYEVILYFKRSNGPALVWQANRSFRS